MTDAEKRLIMIDKILKAGSLQLHVYATAMGMVPRPESPCAGKPWGGGE